MRLPVLDETIVALASAPGGAARGVIRVAGPAALAVVGPLFTPHEAEVTVWSRLAPRGPLRAPRAVRGELRLPSLHSPLPAEAYVWPTLRSYSGQPTVELHLCGSPPLLSLLLESLCQKGARMAQPGEFTLRAFLAGRIDLAQAEAVLGVIDADGPASLRVALSQLAGGLTRPLARRRARLVDLLADLEAGLDFAEEDITFVSRERMLQELSTARDELIRLAGRLSDRGEIRDVAAVVLRGSPNAGKSSLFNALAGGRAIVSPVAGTTRDFLEAELDLFGVACRIIDTAGIEEISVEETSEEKSSQEETGAARPEAGELAGAAARMTDFAADRALLSVYCLDGDRAPTERELAAAESTRARGGLVVRTKADRCQLRPSDEPGEAIWVSAISGAGLDALKTRLNEKLAGAAAKDSAVLATTAARCQDAISRAVRKLAAAITLARENAGEELVAAALRSALSQLGEISGEVYTDELLDRIFSRFCIGK